MTSLSPDYLGFLRADVEAMRAAAWSAGLDVPVPSCPGWSMADLLLHTAGVFQRVAATVGGRLQEAVDRSTLPALGDDAVGAFNAEAAAVIEALEGAAPDEPVFNWSVNQPKVAGFWRRRMAQECVIHRWDAELAASGAAGPIDPALAVDGVDELLDVFFPARAAWFPDAFALHGSLHLHCTDVAGEWLVRLGGGVVDVGRDGGGQGDANVRGPASDLLLFAWNRLGPDAPGLASSGDPAVFESWRELKM
jgi:uncharacterized protein (TIGR03083 family)